jgi:hypothetical protein
MRAGAPDSSVYSRIRPSGTDRQSLEALLAFGKQPSLFQRSRFRISRSIEQEIQAQRNGLYRIGIDGNFEASRHLAREMKRERSAMGAAHDG